LQALFGGNSAKTSRARRSGSGARKTPKRLGQLFSPRCRAVVAAIGQFAALGMWKLC
jgi:hypothetical protein